jgi:hypothetical protein
MPQHIRSFRLFVSSTFSDLKEERNALHRTAFPALKKLCEDNGFRFQAIDLRWGVREEAGLDQQTVRICLDEVKRCCEGVTRSRTSSSSSATSTAGVRSPPRSRPMSGSRSRNGCGLKDPRASSASSS